MEKSLLPLPTRPEARCRARGRDTLLSFQQLLPSRIRRKRARSLLTVALVLAGCGEAFTAGDDSSTGGAASAGRQGFGGAQGSGGQSISTARGGSGSGGQVSANGGGASGSEAGGGGGDVPQGGGAACSSSDSPALAACTVIEALGVFVSPLGSDSKGTGTREAPFATLGSALRAARKESKRVYACSSAGAFKETLLIDSSVDQSELYGGFDCLDWTYSAEQPTAVVSSTPRALVANDLTSLVVEDFAFTAQSATEPSDSSAAAWITRSSGVIFRRVSLTAGSGADGADGAGTHDPAASGADGNSGTAACTVAHAPNDGGASVQTECDGPTDSVGGNGGDAGSDNKSGGNGSPGEPLVQGNRGQAGYGETLATTWNCGVGAGLGGGQMGSDATSEPGALGAATSTNDQGVLGADGFVGIKGQDGANGTPGQGGGGGGGAIAPNSCGNGVPRTGASGGSGGGGGCGGKGGKGGGAGGGSFALVSFKSTITLEGGTLIASNGGRGGNGGYGQPGGAGGKGGQPGNGYGSSHAACTGGAGGLGGSGGHGGGGAGGPSAAIAFAGGLGPVKIGTLLLSAKVAAPGGTDGAGSTKGTGVGSSGTLSEVLALAE